MSAEVRPRLCWLAPSPAAQPIVDRLAEQVDVIVLDGPPPDGWCAVESAVADLTVVHPEHLDARPVLCSAARRLALEMLDGTTDVTRFATHLERADLLLLHSEDQATLLRSSLENVGVAMPVWEVLSPASDGTAIQRWLLEAGVFAPAEIGPAASRVDQLEAAMHTLLEALESRGARLEEVEALLDAARGRLSAREAALQEEFAGRLEAAAAAEAAWSAGRAAFEARVAALEAELAATRAQGDHAAVQRDVVEADRAGVAGELHAARGHAATDAARIQDLEQTVRALEQTLQSAAGHAGAAAALGEQMERSRNRLQQANAAEIAAKSALAAGEAERSMLRAQLAEAGEVAANQARRLNALRKIPGARLMWRLFNRAGRSHGERGAGSD